VAQGEGPKFKPQYCKKKTIILSNRTLSVEDVIAVVVIINIYFYISSSKKEAISLFSLTAAGDWN
jgi:hypothetical protein